MWFIAKQYWRKLKRLLGYDNVKELERWYEENYENGLPKEDRQLTSHDCENELIKREIESIEKNEPRFHCTTITDMELARPPIRSTYRTNTIDMNFHFNIKEKIKRKLEPDIYAGTMMSEQPVFEPHYK